MVASAQPPAVPTSLHFILAGSWRTTATLILLTSLLWEATIRWEGRAARVAHLVDLSGRRRSVPRPTHWSVLPEIFAIMSHAVPIVARLKHRPEGRIRGLFGPEPGTAHGEISLRRVETVRSSSSRSKFLKTLRLPERVVVVRAPFTSRSLRLPSSRPRSPFLHRCRPRIKKGDLGSNGVTLREELRSCPLLGGARAG